MRVPMLILVEANICLPRADRVAEAERALAAASGTRFKSADTMEPRCL